MAVMLSYPSTSPGVHVHAPLTLGAGAAGEELDGGLEQLFGQLLVQIQQQLTAAAGAEGEGLPIDGDSLPPEMVRADLRAQLQEGLESSDLIDTELSEQQLEALIDSAVARLQSAGEPGEAAPPFRLTGAPVLEGGGSAPRSQAAVPVGSGVLTLGAYAAEGASPGVEVSSSEGGEFDAQPKDASRSVSPSPSDQPQQVGSAGGGAAGQRESQRVPPAVALDPSPQQEISSGVEQTGGRQSQQRAEPGGESDQQVRPADARATRSGASQRDEVAVDQAVARDAQPVSSGAREPSTTASSSSMATGTNVPAAESAATANAAVGVQGDERAVVATTQMDAGRAEPGARTDSGAVATPVAAMARGDAENPRPNPAGGARQEGVIGEDGSPKVAAEARQARDDGPQREREPESGGAGVEARKGLPATLRSGDGSVAASIASLLNLPQPKTVALPQNPPPVGQLQSLYQGAPPGTFAFGLPQRFGSEAWTSAASQRISLMVSQRLSGAEIRLDPPELGSLHVRLTLNQDQASLSFTSPHPHVREALEQQMPRLREMLAEAGINLQQSDVSDQSSSRSRQHASEGWDADADGGGPLERAETPPPPKALLSLVDAYA
ncbi:MAG TPA: flagellar hook-length control protein FliK [Motiliproteus sp.]